MLLVKLQVNYRSHTIRTTYMTVERRLVFQRSVTRTSTDRGQTHVTWWPIPRCHRNKSVALLFAQSIRPASFDIFGASVADDESCCHARDWAAVCQLDESSVRGVHRGAPDSPAGLSTLARVIHRRLEPKYVRDSGRWSQEVQPAPRRHISPEGSQVFCADVQRTIGF